MMTNPLKPLTLAILAASATGLTGCLSSSSDGDSGSLSLGITDAPVDSLQEVNITFTGVTLKPADGSKISIDLDGARTLDMLELQRGNAAQLLEDQSVPAGDYNWIRLELDQDQMFVVEDGGGEVDLTVPSGSQQGLRLVSGFTVPQGSSADFTIDFDVRKAVTKPGSQKKDYKLRPALRLVDNAEAGAIEGTVFSNVISNQCDTSFNGAVYVYEGQDADLIDYNSNTDADPLMAATVDKAEGESKLSYRAAFLTEGDYTIAYSCDPDDPEAKDSLTFTGSRNVTVVAGETQPEDFGNSQ